MALSDEERALRDADRAHKQRVKEAERALAAAEDGTLVASYAKAKLYADRLVHRGDTLVLAPDMKVDVQAAGTKTSGKDASDTRELYLIVENVTGGLTIKCRPDDGEEVRAFAQKVRLAAPGGQDAGAVRQTATSSAAAALAKIRADRGDIESAERALPPEAIEKVRRRQRWGWVKWAGGTFLAVLVIATIVGGGEDDETASSPTPATPAQTTTTGAPARADTGRATPPPPPPTPLTAREKLGSALGALDAEVTGTADAVVVTAATPTGGFDGASTGDLNRAVAPIFKAIYGEAGYHREAIVVFRGGLVDSNTGEDLPDAKTAQYRMTRTDGDRIDWSDEDRLLNVRWQNFREFAHPAIKDDE